MITITHTHAEGTVAEGTARGDAAGPILRQHGFTFRYGAWIIRGSRDRMARRWDIDDAADTLRAAGFEVTVEIDDTPRPVAEVEAERAERAAARAERFGGYAESAQRRSETAGARADQISDGIPLGQPVLVGHHSQPRHERLLKKMHDLTSTSAEENRRARHWDNRAESAEHSQRYREGIPTTLRRIERLEVDLRRIERNLVGEPEDSPYRTRMTPRVAQLADQITYWKAHVAEAEAAGVKVWGPADFVRGDWVKDTSGRWHLVVRVNKKTLSVPPLFAELSGTRTLPYDSVAGRRSAAEVAAAKKENHAEGEG